ncbi:uncharacterized protein LOC118434227 [Folsomia candida]|uniref:uncharacterized protein LOC118434227 n=1 Tax=Folsomia candida TaxID=158441 RepID=UPI0016053372|nr:uncharacterized protein LOC118434227 [Folsomia candida]
MSPIPLHGRLFHIRAFLLLVLLPLFLSGLEDDIFYFTSFNNVSEWADVYSTCDINFTYQYRFEKVTYLHFSNADGYAPPSPAPDENWTPLFLSLDVQNLPNTLSPIEINHKDTHCMVESTKRNCLNFDPHTQNESVLMIYNNPPPPLGSFKVSFGFQKNKECVTNSQFAPCYVNPEFGRIRGVVLTADRENLRSVREQFTVEKPNDYISIINGGSPNEKKFYEAIFMGSSEPLDCKDKRSSHIIDGKCYPMEIYMYFVDETIPTMALTTILVVQVELGETENPNIRPVVDAVSNLYNEERLFLAKYDHQTRDNRMFHHMGPSSVLRNTHNETDTDYFFIPSSIDVERQITSMMDHFERVQTYKAKTFFTFELYESTKEIENKLVRSAVFQTVPPLKNELLLNTTTNKPIQLPKLLDKLNLTEYQTENPRTVSDLTILKMRLQRYLVTAAYNNHLDHLLRENITLNIPKLDNAWPGAYEGNPMKPNFTFTDLVNKFLNHRYKVEEILKQEGNESSTLEVCMRHDSIHVVFPP